MADKLSTLVAAVDKLASSLSAERIDRILSMAPTYRFEESRSEIENIIAMFDLRDEKNPIIQDIMDNYDQELMFYGPESRSISGLSEGNIIFSKLQEELTVRATK
jgi:hypothetical protein